MIGSCEITEQLRNKTKQDVLTGSILDLRTGETEDVTPVLFLLYRKLLRNVPIKQQQSLVKIQRKGLRTAGTVIYYISSEK